MNNNLSYKWILSLLFLFATSQIQIINAQNAPVSATNGRLLQGEKWLPFSYPAKADFYVSPFGNDTWSGKLAEPNGEKNDGPFLTIDRAMKAVRDLKSQVYKPKDTPVEKRWIGSPHPF